MAALKVGAGRGVITPPVGAWLMGYAPGRQAKSVHDDLAVTVIALEYGGAQALLISADVCLIRNPQSEQFRAGISEATGIAFENIILAGTHTHSGPAMRPTPGGAPADERYMAEIFLPRAIRAAQDALGSLREARMGVGTTLSDVGINRRQMQRDGSIVLGQNPWGCHDPVMTVLSFRTPQGKPIANLIHYGAHNTASGINSEITRDWAGPMVDRLEEESGAMTVYFNGAEGDCGPRLPNGRTTGDIRLAMELGGRAAIDAVRAYRSIREYRDADARALCEPIQLPYKPFPSADEIQRRIEQMGDPSKLVGLQVMDYEMQLQRLALSRTDQPRERHMKLLQTILSVGPVAFVPFPFEIFTEITLRIRQYSPYAHTLSLSNANGASYYFPSQDQICRGGYEVWVFQAMSLYTLSDHADDAIVLENLRLLDTLYAL